MDRTVPDYRISSGRGGDVLNTKKADYTIEMAPDHIVLECPHCEIDFEVDFNDLRKLAKEEYDLWNGNANVTVTCDYCEQEVELGNAEVD